MERTVRKISVSLVIALLLSILSFQFVFASEPLTDDQLMDLESRASFNYFWECANTDPDSPGYGLVRDKFPAPQDADQASLASVGFGLTALTIGAERGWVTREQAEERAIGTLNTMLNNIQKEHGFFYHWVNMDDAQRWRGSEVSVIDTSIAINGAISAGEYFGGQAKLLAQQIYENVDWDWFIDKNDGLNKNQFFSARYPETGFTPGHWDVSSEALMLYILSASSPTHPIDPIVYNSFKRLYGSYPGYPTFVHSWFGSMFTYQFSHAWYDFRNTTDRDGIDWFRNSVIAAKVNRQFCIDQPIDTNNTKKFITYGPDAWGVSASEDPYGYNGALGAYPSGDNLPGGISRNDQNHNNGTLAPYGAIASMPFTPEESLSAMRNYYDNYDGKLWTQYGFTEAFNTDVSPAWYDVNVLGIDKGITLLMIENYRSNLIWNLMNKNKYVQAGLKKVGILTTGATVVDDFEGNTLAASWADNGDSVYVLSDEHTITNTGLGSKRVDYNKNGFEWTLFSAALKEPRDFSQADDFKFSVLGSSGGSQTGVLVKFENDRGAGLMEKVFSFDNDNTWKKITWAMTSDEKAKLINVKRILFFVAPGNGAGTGTFYMDDVEFAERVPSASNIEIIGKAIAGETITGMYSYYDPLGKDEGASEPVWSSSDSLNGTYTPISGATGETYAIKDADVGKYLKFLVTPKTVVESETGLPRTGKTFTSPSVGPVEVSYPQVRNLTIIKDPVDVSVLLDNFDGDRLGSDWMDSGDRVYNFSLDPNVKYSGANSLKVDYNKAQFDWAFFSKNLTDSQNKGADMSRYNLLTAKVRGNITMLLKFEYKDGGARETQFAFTGGDTWQDLVYDLSAIKDELTNVGRILIFAAPGKRDETGTFYLDDMQLIQRTIQDVTTAESPKVGEMLNASYEYYDANGDLEAGTGYRWLISTERDGQYSEIGGTAAPSYIPTAADEDKFIKVEVTPRNAGNPSVGPVVLSAAANAVILPSPPAANNVGIRKYKYTNYGFDNCDSTNGWSDGGDKVYTISTDTSMAGKKNSCLKVEYNKGAFEWTLLYKTVEDPGDFTNYDLLTARVYGDVTLLLKLETAGPARDYENVFTLSGNGWQDIEWDISSFKSALNDVDRLLIFAAPGKAGESCTFYLDDISFVKRDIVQVTDDGKLRPGDTAVGCYEYYDKQGDKEGSTKYRWLRSNSANGAFTPIEGANSSTYVLTPKDTGKYLKFEVTPVSEEQPFTGETVSSPAVHAYGNANGQD